MVSDGETEPEAHDVLLQSAVLTDLAFHTDVDKGSDPRRKGRGLQSLIGWLNSIPRLDSLQAQFVDPVKVSR